MGEHINPLQFCTSTSTDYAAFVANGGGACVYSADPQKGASGVRIADIYDCVTAVSMTAVKEAMDGAYNVHPQADGICCPNRGNRLFFGMLPTYNVYSQISFIFTRYSPKGCILVPHQLMTYHKLARKNEQESQSFIEPCTNTV